MKNAEKKNDMTLLTQGNAIKRKSSKTTKEPQYLEETTLEELIEKCKKLINCFTIYMPLDVLFVSNVYKEIQKGFYTLDFLYVLF